MGLGTLKLEEKCKAYTNLITLEAATNSGSTNLTSRIPTTNIIEDDCCRTMERNISLNNFKLEPITLTNIDLNELKFAKTRLNQFDEILQQQLNKPFIIQHSSWITPILAIIACAALTTLVYKLFKWFGVLNWLSQCLCFAKEQRNSSEKLKSLCCLPCVKIYNQSYNRGYSEPPTAVHYDTELERLNYPKPEEQSATKVPSRRSTRSRKVSDSQNLKIISV